MAEEADVDFDEVDADVRASVNDDVDDNADDDAPEYTEAEQKAMDKGWNPEGVEGKRNISADEFLDRESFFDRIHKLEQNMKRKEKTIDALQEFNKQTEDKAYKKAIKDLKTAKKEAAKEEDLERVIEIDEQIESLTDAKEEATAAAPPAQAYPQEEWADAYSAFTSNNVWYGRIPDLTNRADALGTGYIQQNPTASPDDVYKHVLSTVKKEFPQEFENKQRKRPAAVGTADKSAPAKKGKAKFSLKDVDESDREMAKVIIASGVPEAEYLRQYFLDK